MKETYFRYLKDFWLYLHSNIGQQDREIGFSEAKCRIFYDQWSDKLMLPKGMNRLDIVVDMLLIGFVYPRIDKNGYYYRDNSQELRLMLMPDIDVYRVK